MSAQAELVDQPKTALAGVLSVVIPAYNEAPTIEKILDLVVAVKINVGIELIIVDDGSTDGTALPVALMSRLRIPPVYLVATTMRSRSPARNSPRKVSLVPAA
jgi:hypothetical protein